MTQLAAVFPEDISQGATGGAQFKTQLVETGSGHEFVNQAWAQPRNTFDVSHAARSQALFGKLRAHFMVAGGRVNAFPFKDWADYKAPDDAGDGIFGLVSSSTSGSIYQFFKRYIAGGFQFNRKIILPKEGTIHIDTDTSGEIGEINYQAGQVTMISGTPLTWTGEFYCLCRYDDDVMRGQIIDGPVGARVEGWSGIQIIELAR